MGHTTLMSKFRATASTTETWGSYYKIGELRKKKADRKHCLGFRLDLTTGFDSDTEGAFECD
jgi:hypothetical protein